MIRVQIKNVKLRYDAVLELLQRGYDVNVSNRNGDCFYVWTDGQKRCDIHHWTNDKPIMDVNKNNFRWFVNCLTKPQ